MDRWNAINYGIEIVQWQTSSITRKLELMFGRILNPYSWEALKSDLPHNAVETIQQVEEHYNKVNII